MPDRKNVIHSARSHSARPDFVPLRSLVPMTFPLPMPRFPVPCFPMPRFRWAVLCLAVLWLGVASTGHAQSADFFVTPTGTGDGSSWATAADLPTALAAAAPADTVKLKMGTYALTTDDATFHVNTNLMGGYPGEDEAEAPQPFQLGAPTQRTLLSGSDVADNVVTASGGSVTNLVIEGGNADGDSPHGAAVYADLDADLTLEKVMVQQNASEGYGAVHVTAHDNDFTMKNAKVVANENGGVYFTGDAESLIAESTFFGNTHDRHPESTDILLDEAPNIIVANNSLENIDIGNLVQFNVQSHEIGDYLYSDGDAPGVPDQIGYTVGNVNTTLDLSTGPKTLNIVQKNDESIEFENDSDYVRRFSAYNSSNGPIPDFQNLEQTPRIADHHPTYDITSPTTQLGVMSISTTDINDGSTISLNHIPTVDPEGNNVEATYEDAVEYLQSGVYTPQGYPNHVTWIQTDNEDTGELYTMEELQPITDAVNTIRSGFPVPTEIRYGTNAEIRTWADARNNKNYTEYQVQDGGTPSNFTDPSFSNEKDFGAVFVGSIDNVNQSRRINEYFESRTGVDDFPVVYKENVEPSEPNDAMPFFVELQYSIENQDISRVY